MARLRSLVFLLLSACALLAACGTAPPLPAEPVVRGDLAAVQRQLAAYVEHELSTQKLAGLSIALVEGDRLLWSRGFGWADVDARVPAGPQTLYRVGSISKLFTDTAAMQLVAQGRLDLDAPVQQVLPWFRIGSAWPAAGPITLRHLMSHRAGLPRDMAGGMWLAQAPPPERDFRAMLRSLADEQVAAPPGLAFGYSNVGIDLVGAMVEAASGRPFEAQLQSAVLDPIGMSGARFSAEVPALPAMARGHRKGRVMVEPALRDVPAGGLTASVEDLARFLSLQFAQGRGPDGRVVLPAAQQAAMLQPGGAPLDFDLRIGLGWMFTTFGTDTVHGGGPVAHHAGATFHHRAQLMMLPEQGLGVAVASNDGAAGDVVNRVAQRALALLLEARRGVRQPGPTPGFVPAARPWNEVQWQGVRAACAGEYTTLVGPVSLTPDGPRLAAQAAGHGLELREGEDGRFGLRYRLLGLLPVALGPLASMGFECRRVQGRDLLVVVQDGERLLAGERLPAAALPPDPAGWVGRYRPRLVPGELPSLSFEEGARVLLAQGRLWVEYRLHPAFGGATVRVPVQAIGERQVRLLGVPSDTGPVATLLEPVGAPRQLRFSGWTFERVGD